jgi:RNA polymerase sigma-70 factor (ECF subfamily)
MSVRAQTAGLEAIEEVYRARFDEFVRVARAITGDAETARDAVQDAFATAVRKRRDYRGEGPLAAWLWRAVVNKARDAGRARRPPAEASAENGNGEAGHDHDVRALLALLPERQRIAIFLRYYVDLDYASIAEILEISEGTVAATLHAARRSLRRRLEEEVLR